MKILFLLKDRAYNSDLSKSYGLSNSARQVAEYLQTLGHECSLVSVIDANFIDKELFAYKPDVAIIEALWVQPDKLKQLMELPRYKHIKWIIRVHSDIGFLSAETMASKMILGYIELGKPNLYISTNNEEFNYYYSGALNYDFEYLPNIITLKNDYPAYKPSRKRMDVACFGALRTMKNQCFQALCAIEAANKLGKHLYFHVTANIVRDDPNYKPNPVLTNLEAIFEHSGHDLVVHEWMPHDLFENLIQMMDMGMQLSYTESFNIVAADFINMGVPIVTSEAVTWMPKFYTASTTNYKEVVDKVIFFYLMRNFKSMIWAPRKSLKYYNKSAQKHWKKFIENISEIE